jgi:hypothetical protein
MRLHGVEIRVSLDGGQTTKALRLFGLADVKPWQIFFIRTSQPGFARRRPC